MNGYLTEREIQTGIGHVALTVPSSRDPDLLLAFYDFPAVDGCHILKQQIG